MLDIKRALQNGEVLTGPFSLSGSPTLVETIGYAGFDFVIIDCQHGATSPFGSELEQQIRAAYAADIAPVVRTADNDRGQILKAMDFGAKGVIVPQVNTAEEARQAVSYTHYAPVGRRSATSSVRAAKHGFVEWSEHYRRMAEESLLFVLIEESSGIQNAEDIAAVEGLGGIFFGPFDLAISMGAPESVYDSSDDSPIQAHRKAVYEIAKSRGLSVADLAWDIDSAKMMIELGAQFVALGTDVTMFANSCRDLHEEVDQMKLGAIGARSGARGETATE